LAQRLDQQRNKQHTDSGSDEYEQYENDIIHNRQLL
jgi:hypothetical protein